MAFSCGTSSCPVLVPQEASPRLRLAASVPTQRLSEMQSLGPHPCPGNQMRAFQQNPRGLGVRVPG